MGGPMTSGMAHESRASHHNTLFCLFACLFVCLVSGPHPALCSGVTPNHVWGLNLGLHVVGACAQPMVLTVSCPTVVLKWDRKKQTKTKMEVPIA